MTPEEQIAALVVELEATTYHQALRTYVERRIGALMRADVTTADVAMKCRGQLEELARIVAPAATQAFAMLALERRAFAAAQAGPAAPAPHLLREWWLEPGEEPVQ